MHFRKRWGFGLLAGVGLATSIVAATGVTFALDNAPSSRPVSLFNDVTPGQAASRVVTLFNDVTPGKVISRVVTVFNENNAGRISAVSRIVQIRNGPPVDACSNVFSVNPAETYLRTNGETQGTACLRVPLAAIDVQPGDYVLVQQAGAFAEPGYTEPTRYTTSLYATAVDLVDGWDFENDATGAPHTCDAVNTALQRYEYDVRDAWLEASDFTSFAVPPDQRVTKVELDVFGGHDPTNGGIRSPAGATSRLRCELRLSGATAASMLTDTWTDNALQCSWRLADSLGGNGWDITPYVAVNGTVTSIAINSIGMRVRRCPSCGDRWLRVNSFRLTVTTESTACPTVQTGRDLIGVFSSSNQLLDASAAARVPGALDAGDDYATSPTSIGSLPTDIPEDFVIAGPEQVGLVGSTLVRVPPGAQYLFIAADDNFYADNCDSDGDYSVAISRIDAGCPGVSEVPPLPEVQDKSPLFVSAPYPNPSRGSVTLDVTASRPGEARLDVFDISGRRVKHIEVGGATEGRFALHWDGTDSRGGAVQSGVYFLRLHAGFESVTRRVMVLTGR